MAKILTILTELREELELQNTKYDFKLFGQRFRYCKNDKGYFSERLQKGFLVDKWVPVVTFRGLNDVYYYKSLQSCNEGFINHIKEEIRYTSGKII